jgi:hypothetical protein
MTAGSIRQRPLDLGFSEILAFSATLGLLLIPTLLFTACATRPGDPATANQKDSAQNFIVMLEGRNFVFDHEGHPTRFGFSTTRKVVAPSKLEADETAIQMVRDDETLNRSLLNSPDDPPRVSATHRIEVESFEAVPTPDLGYIFYRDRDSK